MPKLSQSTWFPVLCSLVITIGAFGGITYWMLKKITAEQLLAKTDSHDSHAKTDSHGDSHAKTDSHDSHAKTDSHGDASHWSYTGETGPEHWEQFAKIAKSGIRQSPIDLITDKSITPINLTPVDFRYQDSVFTLNNNGHTVQADCDAENNSVLINGHHYALLQFHFHAKSEHLIDGKDYPMEVHLVHIISDKQEDAPPPVAASKPAQKSLAVVGVMIKEGKENPFIKNLWKKIPEAKGTPVHYFITGQNANALLPPLGKRSFYRYNGSLTTPPCTENVLWTVMNEPIEFSKEQIEAFTKLYKKNNRPAQKTHQRFVLRYQDAGIVPQTPHIAPVNTPPIPSTQPVAPAQPTIPALPKGQAGIQPSTIKLKPAPFAPAPLAPITPKPIKPALTVNE